MIGSLGDYDFEVSAEQVKTFTDLAFSNSASYAEHKIIGRKSLLEFTSLNPSTCSLNIPLSFETGTDPMEEITYFYTAMNDHEALAFTLGGDVMGEGLWVIESLEEKYTRIDSKGNVMAADLSLKLKEYLDDE